MFFSRPAGDKFISRGDLAVYDFVTANFTIDYEWHTLDLSAIVPVGSHRISIEVSFRGSVGTELIIFKNDDYVNNRNRLPFLTTDADIQWFGSGMVDCSGDRKIKYKFNSTVVDINLSVLGWVRI